MDKKTEEMFDGIDTNHRWIIGILVITLSIFIEYPIDIEVILWVQKLG